MLALVVRGTAAIETVAAPGQFPGRQALLPLRLQAADHVAMAVAEHGCRRVVLAPLGNQDRPATNGVVEDATLEAETLQGRCDLVAEIGAEHRTTAFDLALGRDRYAATKVGGEPAFIEISLGGGNGGG